MCSPTRRHLSSSTSLQQATTATETTAASGGDQLELLHSLFAHAADRMSEPSASDRGSDKPNLCPVEAQPAPDRFQWSFVGLEELARLADGKVGLKQMFGELNQTARWQTEAKLPTKRPGILLCRAANSLGWQTTRPCLTLLAAGTKTGKSGARKFFFSHTQPQNIAFTVSTNRTEKTDQLHFRSSELAPPDCSLRLQRPGRRRHQHHHDRKQAQQQQRQRQRLELDCARSYRTEEQDEVMLQIRVSRLDDADQQWRKSFLVSSRSLPHRITDLAALFSRPSSPTSSSPTSPTSSSSSWSLAANRSEQEADEVSAAEQQVIALEHRLAELVFTLRAANLAGTSAPRAIYGRDLEVARSKAAQDESGSESEAEDDAEAADAAAAADGEAPAAQQAVQVLRSATNEQLLLTSLDGSPEPGSSSSAGGRSPAATVSSSPSTTAATSGRTQKSAGREGESAPKRGHEYEIGIAIAAIAGTCVLSLLTLTLIVLLLAGSSSQRLRRRPASHMAASSWPAASANHANGGELAPAKEVQGIRAGWRRLFKSKSTSNNTTTTTTTSTSVPLGSTDGQLEGQLELRPASVASSSAAAEQPAARLVICDERSSSTAAFPLQSVDFLAPAKVRTASERSSSRQDLLACCLDSRNSQYEARNCAAHERGHASSHLSLFPTAEAHLRHARIHGDGDEGDGDDDADDNGTLYVIESPQQAHGEQEHVLSVASSGSSRLATWHLGGGGGGHSALLHQRRPQFCKHQQQHHQLRAINNSNNNNSGSCCCSPATCDSSRCDELASSLATCASNLTTSQAGPTAAVAAAAAAINWSSGSGSSARQPPGGACESFIESVEDFGGCLEEPSSSAGRRTVKTTTLAGRNIGGQQKLGDDLFLFSFL